MRRIKTNSLGARILSGFLSLLMVVSACPVTAFADDDVDNTPVETTTIVVDENGVHVDGEDNDSYTIIVEDESNDENVDAIPGDEDAQDQDNPDVDTPPNIDNGSDTDGTDPDTVISVDDEDEDNTDEDAEPTEEDEIVDEDPIDEEEVEETAEPEYEYSVTLPSDKTVSEGDTLEIEAEVVAKVTIDEETKDVEYTFEFSGDGVNIETKSATGAAITFDKAGEYTIVGKLIVDDEEVASDEMTIKVNPIVVFDHYFTEIDESLVETSDLLVKTSDSSVFTKNTNVVSNFDDVYIIECSSVEEARYVYSYYVDKVDSISDLSKVISIATDENNEDVADLEDLNDGNDALAQLNEEVENTETTDYSDYIALIDTGSDNADVKFSVVGDDVNDSNGHGSRMLELIKSENPDAKVMSIKVFNGSTTDAASVYSGIKLAIANNVKIINLSLVGSDVEKNAIVKDVIQEAINNGIVVIGAAGNYNISATKFIPGCIDAVITIGAANSDGSKKSISNYDADYYVVADYTSDATAIFTGLYSAGITESSILFDGDYNPTIIEEVIEPERDLSDLDANPFIKAFVEQTGYDYSIDENGKVEIYIPEEEESEPFDFVLQGTATNVEITKDVMNTISGTYTGTCSFTPDVDNPGYGYVTISGNNNVFEQIFNGRTIDVDCEGHEAHGNNTQSHYAFVLTGPTVNYQATATVSDNGNTTNVVFSVLFSNDNFKARTWTEHTDTYTVDTTIKSTSIEHLNGSGKWVNGALPDGKTEHRLTIKTHWKLTKKTDDTTVQTWEGDYTYENNSLYLSTSDMSTYENTAKSNAAGAAAAEAKKHVVVLTPYKGKRNVGDLTGLLTSGGLSQKYEQCTQNQIYAGSADAWCWNYIYLNLRKQCDEQFQYLVRGNSYFSLEGATFAVYSDSNFSNPVKDAISNQDVIFTVDANGNSTSTATLLYNLYQGHTLYIKETKTGRGYNAGETGTVSMNIGGGETATAVLNNTPLTDPTHLQFVKISDKTGQPVWDAGTRPENAEYTITMYELDANGNATDTVLRTSVFKTDEYGKVDFEDPYYFVRGDEPLKHPLINNIYCWTYGYYTIQETKVPTNAQQTGLIRNTSIYKLYYRPNTYSSGGTNVTAAYKKFYENDILVYDTETGYVNSDYKYGGDDLLYTYEQDEDIIRTVEGEVWYPLGIYKADMDFAVLGYTSNTILGIPEGSSTYDGAQFQLFTTTTQNTYGNSFFSYTMNNPNGTKVLSLGSGVSSVSTLDGFGVAGTTSFGTTLYPVLSDGQPVVITTNSNGYAQTDLKFPYSSEYRFVEIKAPTGYTINTQIQVVTDNWTTGENGDTLIGLDNYSGHVNAVGIINSRRFGAAEDLVYRYGFAMWKKDLTNSNDTLSNTQGNTSLNGIRFAVINRSNNHVVMRSIYNTVDSSYVTINDSQEIGKDRICAVITTHTHNGLEGYLTMYGLPYGVYDIVELKYDAADNTSLIGQTYDGNGMGNSTYANNSGIMWDGSNYFSIDYTTAGNKLYHGDSSSSMSHFTWNYNTPTSNPDHIAENKAFVDGFQGYKLDEDYLQVTEGDSNANGIRFAVINRSAYEVEILQSDINQLSQVDPNWNATNTVLNVPNVQFIPGGTSIAGIGTGNANARIAPGEVVAILTTHNGPSTVTAGTHTGAKVDGYFAIYGLPYGTYEVVELRRDAEISVGQNWNSVNKGTSIYANDSFYWNNISITYDLTDINHSTPHNTVSSALAIHNDPYNTGTSRYTDDVYRDGFSFWKRDSVYHFTTDHPQGDSTWNDIRFVVINRSDDQVKMFNKYTQLMPTSDQPYVEIRDNVAINPGCVVAILTSHQKSNVATDELTKGYEQGYVSLYGLPYGQYEIRELRSDATIQVGENYDTSTKLGTSCFANYRTNSQLNSIRTAVNGNPSMLYRGDIYFYYTLHDTGTGSDDHNGGNVSNGGAGTATAGELIAMGDLYTVDDNGEDTWDNETVYGNIRIRKIDDETKITGHNQGSNKLNHVQFAIVNRSYWSVCYPYTEDLANAEDRYFAPNEVIAVLETDENGECFIEHLPYGTYEVYELRINQSYNTQVRTINIADNNGQLIEKECYGNSIQPHFVWNDQAMAAYKDWTKDCQAKEAGTAVNGIAGQEGQYFGNDDRANEWYTWNENIANYFVVQPEWKHQIGSAYKTHTEDDRTIRGYNGLTTNKQYGPTYVPQEFQFTWSDLPIRGDFRMQKVNLDGRLMAYVPWLVSLVESDENGDPIQNADGSYNVIEQHVMVLDFDSTFDSRNWDARPKTVNNVNQYDSYVTFDTTLNKLVWTGTKEDLKNATTGNIWFGELALEQPNSKYLTNKRGALLAGTYVIQEIPRVTEYGYPKNGEGAQEEINLGNGQVRTIMWNTEDYDMISSTLRVIHDNPNPVFYLDDWDIGVDVPLTIESEAIDAITETNSTIPDSDGLLRDTVTFGGLTTTQRYGYITYIWRCDEDGNPIEKIYTSDMCTLDFTGDTHTEGGRTYNTIRNANTTFESVMPGTFVTEHGSFTVVDNNYVLFRDADGNFTQEYAPQHDPTYNRIDTLYNLSIIQDFNLDTSMMQEGEKLVFAVDLYKSMGTQGWSLLKQHNQYLDEKSQYVGVIKFSTESTDKTTRTRVAGIGGYAYGEEGMPLVNNAENTGNLVYNADGEIVGYTLIDDKIVYSNLGDGHNYRFTAKLTYVDENGNDTVVKDIYGHDCSTGLVAILIDKDLDHVVYGTDIVYENNGANTILQHSLEGPCDGEITFSDLGIMDWIIPNMPNDAETVYIKTYLYDASGPVITCHNFDLDEEEENIRWIQIDTTAMSEDGEEGILPNGRSWDLDGNLIKNDAILRDRIDYSNLAEAIDVRVEGYVYLVGYDEEGNRVVDKNNGLDTPYVAHETKNFSLTDTEGSLEMQYNIIDSGQYANRDLVVCERVYMELPGHAGVHADGKYVPGPGSEMDARHTVYTCVQCGETFTSYDESKYHERRNHHHCAKQIRYDTITNDNYYLNDDGTTEVLIALHEDLNDMMQTVSIPEIETHLVNRHEGTNYKVVSREYADVTVYDTVTFKNLKVGEPWVFTAELMDQETKQPVLDAEGNPVVATGTITPDANNSTIDPVTGRAYGTIEIPITFKQVLTALDWESDPSWVCFESMTKGDNTEFKYAVHNNIYDERQTVHLPTFRTTVVSTVADPAAEAAVNAKDRQIQAAPNQTITDTVEIKNVGLDTVIKSNLKDTDNTITDIIPSTFTLRIAAVDGETGEPIVDADGKQFTATKKVIVDVKRDADGKVITPYVTTINGVENSGEAFFKQYPDGNGTDFTQLLLGTDDKPILVDIDLTIDATKYKGKTIMFEERLYFGEFDTEGHEVLIEDDFTNVEQQVTVPDLHTTAVDAETGEHTITISGNNATGDDWYLHAEDPSTYDWKIKDTVSMNKITPNTDYTLVTIVINKDTGKPVVNLADGSKFIQYTPYKSPASVATGAAVEYKCECGKDGCVGIIAVDDEFDIELNLNKTDARNGGTFVVYEYMLLGTNNTYVPDETVAVPNDCYAYHNDINDAEQTIVIPEIHTEFLESHTEIHVVPLEEDTTVTDYVHYTGLVPGKKYIMQCVLMDKSTGEPYHLTNESEDTLELITQDVPFTASDTGEGDVEVSFTIPADQLHDFDHNLDKDHLNINRTVTDTGTAPEVDDDGNPVVEPTDVSGNDDTRVITNEYTEEEARTERGISDEEKINVTKSTQIIAFERCISDEEPSHVYAIHADIEDEKQTILIPRIFTHLIDTVIGDHVSRWNTKETITDTVTFVSLQADKEYTIKGYLVNVDTGEPILDKDGNRITATKTFIPKDLPDTQVTISDGKLIASGNVDLVFTFDSTALKGTHVVAFEDCYYNEIKVATHSEIDDQWQWTFVPEIGTTANGYVRAIENKGIEYREKVVPYGETVQIVDVVEYNKLLPGVWYDMSGIVMDKETGKALEIDGKTVTAVTRFLPAESSGKVEVIFTLDTTGLEGKTLVVFEECLYVGAKKDGTPNKEAVAKHEDISDEDQTIYIPKVRTTVKDEDGNTQVFLDGTQTQTIIDTVSYEHLVPGKKYTVTGTLVFKREYGEDEEYEYVKDAEGNKITASAEITPTEENSTIGEDGLASGTVNVTFKFNAGLVAGRKVVVFEDMYLNNVRVATHSDINDEKQTFDTSMKLHVKLVKSDFDNHVYVLRNAEITIFTDENCTQIAKDINGNDCVGKTNENGEVEFIIITYDENQIFYAKETKAPFGYKICNTVIPIKGSPYYGASEDKTDYTEDTSLKESDGICAINLKMFDKIIIIPPKTGDNLPILPITILSLLGVLCIGAFFATRRKKTVTDNDSTDNVDEDVEEDVMEAMTSMMTEEIDGDGHNDSGF